MFVVPDIISNSHQACVYVKLKKNLYYFFGRIILHTYATQSIINFCYLILNKTLIILQ